MSPGDRRGCAGALASGRSSAGWPSRAGAWASRAASKRPVPSHHGQRTRCGLAAEAGDQLAAAATGRAGAGIVLDGALTGETRSPAARPSRLGLRGGRADRRIRGLVGGQRAPHRGRHLAVGERAQQTVGAERGLGVGGLVDAEQDAEDGRDAERRAGGQRLEAPSGSIAGLSCSGASGLVNSSAPVGASSSSPSIVSAEPPVLVHSQPSIPCSRGTTAVGGEPLEHREAARLALGLGRPAVDEADVQLAEREPQRLAQQAVDLERRAVRGSAAARRARAGGRTRTAIVTVRPAPLRAGVVRRTLR